MLDVSENALLVNSATAATGWTSAIEAVMKEFQVLDGQVRPLTSILGRCVLSGQSHDASYRDKQHTTSPTSFTPFYSRTLFLAPLRIISLAYSPFLCL